VDAFIISVVGSVIRGLLVLTVVGTVCRCVLVHLIVNTIEKRYTNATCVDD
jgi:hypothetical protein